MHLKRECREIKENDSTRVEARTEHLGNLYDNVCINIDRAHDNLPYQTKRKIKKKSLYLTGGLIKIGFWEKLVDSGIIRDWFNEFNEYWTNCLNCSPLRFHDFFWLRCQYIAFASKDKKEVVRFTPKNGILPAYQQYKNIYSIIHAVYGHAYNPLTFYPIRKYIKNANEVLEYGCGIAPYTYSVLKYGNFKRIRFTVADIRQYTYHFAKWRLSQFNNVSFLDINPEILPSFSIKFDLVLLRKMLSLLPNPLEVVKNIHENMEERAYMVFDYGNDPVPYFDTTLEFYEERERVLKFIEDNFDLIEGKIDKYNSMDQTIVRKK